MCQRRVACKIGHDCDAKAPHRHNQDRRLGPWVSTQRRSYNANKLSVERASILNYIGFDGGGGGGAPQRYWNEMGQRLVAYKSKHNGDSKTPGMHTLHKFPNLENGLITSEELIMMQRCRQST